jgi:hypothetical protein
MTLCPLYGKVECPYYNGGCLHPGRAVDYNCHAETVDIVCRDDAGRRKVVLTVPNGEACVVTVRYPYKEDGK